MSSFYRSAYHPPTETVKKAVFLDNYFGEHQYGVSFEGDSKVYRLEETDIPMDVVFVKQRKGD